MPTSVYTTVVHASVGMGEIAVISGNESAQAILGSCLGIAIYDPRNGLGALAHVVLPTAEGRPGTPGKFVDTAVPWMIRALTAKGAEPTRFVSKLVGGANMFSGNGPLQIGQQNIASARRELAAARIRVVAEHLAGTQGRRVTFVGQSGQIVVETAGTPVATL